MTWDTNTFISSHARAHTHTTFRKVYPHTSSSEFFITNSPVMFLSSPWTSSWNIGHSHDIIYNHTSGHFSFQAKWSAWSSVHFQEASFPLSFRNVRESGYSVESIHPLITPTHPAEVSINQARVFSSLSTDERNSTWGHMCRLSAMIWMFMEH